MVAQVVEKLPVLVDALLQPGVLSRGKGGHVLVAFRALRLAHEGHCNGKAVPEKLPTRAPQSAATGPAYRGYLDFSTAGSKVEWSNGSPRPIGVCSAGRGRPSSCGSPLR